MLPQSRSGCVRVRAGSAPLCPGPLWRGGWAEESPQDGSQDASQFFAGTWMCRRKTP